MQPIVGGFSLCWGIWRHLQAPRQALVGKENMQAVARQGTRGFLVYKILKQKALQFPTGLLAGLALSTLHRREWGALLSSLAPKLSVKLAFKSWQL